MSVPFGFPGVIGIDWGDTEVEGVDGVLGVDGVDGVLGVGAVPNTTPEITHDPVPYPMIVPGVFIGIPV